MIERRFIEGVTEISASRALVNAGWDDVPHLTEQAKQELLNSTPPFLRDARQKGLPSLGAGAIYPLPEEDITVPYFPVPEFWPRAFALDVGWKRTACLWGAYDPTTWILYLYAEYYKGQAEPTIHSEAIKARGIWINGVIDPAAKGRAQKDGEQLLMLYQNLGLRLSLANNAVDAGIYAVWNALAGGRLKIMKHLTSLLAEWRLYRRDEKGNIVKENDHLMDCMRYLVMSGRDVARTRPVPQNAVGYIPADNGVGY